VLCEYEVHIQYSCISTQFAFLGQPVIARLKNMTTLVRESVRFVAEIPFSNEVEWLHKDVLVSNSERYKTTSNGDEHELVIRSCQISDAGNVTFRCKHHARIREKSAKLLVQGKYSEFDLVNLPNRKHTHSKTNQAILNFNLFL